MTDKKETAEKPTGLDLLRGPFPANQISKLPKPTKKQTDTLRDAMNKNDFSLGIRCADCGGWHHKDVIHLDYVGHAALTDRLLDCDQTWNWEPLAFDERGQPCFDSIGGMWIKLTVCGVTRLGYGNPDGKTGGNAIKEVIGDAMRNAAMRFGAALDLWHKGELHVDDDVEQTKPDPTPPKNSAGKGMQTAWKDSVDDSLKPDATDADKAAAYAAAIMHDMSSMKSVKGLDGIWDKRKAYINKFETSYSNLFDEIVDTFERKKNDIQEGKAA